MSQGESTQINYSFNLNRTSDSDTAAGPGTDLNVIKDTTTGCGPGWNIGGTKLNDIAAASARLAGA